MWKEIRGARVNGERGRRERRGKLEVGMGSKRNSVMVIRGRGDSELF